MPRGPRLDAPGTLHHVIIRGIERRRIVDDQIDREDFVSRLGRAAQDTGTAVYAWALMINHAHILIHSGPDGLPAMMRRLLSGYAVYYNRRHERHGHLFQNRYKSIVCDEDAYFKELLRYVHLNPLRAGLVDTLSKLEQYRWCGHGVILNRFRHRWQDRDYVLRWFGEREGEAKKAYREYVKAGIALGSRPELTGGGLIRSMGGWSVVKALRSDGNREKSDERILGGGEFVSKIIQQADDKIRHQLPASDLKTTINEVIATHCAIEGVKPELLITGSRRPPLPFLRKIIALKLVGDHGISLAETARHLGISTSGVAQILRRHRQA